MFEKQNKLLAKTRIDFAKQPERPTRADSNVQVDKRSNSKSVERKKTNENQEKKKSTQNPVVNTCDRDLL